MLDDFMAWARLAVANRRLERARVDLRLNARCDDRSANLDIETAEKIGWLTVWESGMFFAEILDVSSGEACYQSNETGEAQLSLDAGFEVFVSAFAAARS